METLFSWFGIAVISVIFIMAIKPVAKFVLIIGGLALLLGLLLAPGLANYWFWHLAMVRGTP
jgi:hypothetical protein